MPRCNVDLHAVLDMGICMLTCSTCKDYACMQAGKDDSAISVDGTSASLLLFQGSAAVQGLFDYLLTDSIGEGAASMDVPCLLAPMPFPGACLHQLHPQVLHSVFILIHCE